MYNPFSLNQKKILVIGASSGIGRETAIEASKLGAMLYILGRDEQRLNETFNELDTKNKDKYICDITKIDDRIRLLESINSLDGIVYSAGTIKTLPAKFIQSGDIDEIFKTNFHSLVELTTLFLSEKKINKFASLVFISSIAAGISSKPGNAIYSASKAALLAYAKVLATELSARKIRVNSILPGMVKTPFLEKVSIEMSQFEEDEKNYPFGYGTPNDVALAAIYLLSDASQWMTGNSLILDGGLTLQ